MTPEEVTTLVKSINRMWEVRITYGLIRTVWAPMLAVQDAALVMDALQRHARTQTTPYAPSAEQLLEHCHALLDEQRQDAEQVARRQQAAQAATAWRRQSEAQKLPTLVTTPGALRQVLEHVSTDAYALAHVAMNDLGVNRPGREADAVAFCEAQALEQPEERERWIREARLYDRERLKALVTPSHGQRYVPDMTGRTVIEEGGEEREPGDEPDEDC
jgi:hypothetical protein